MNEISNSPAFPVRPPIPGEIPLGALDESASAARKGRALLTTLAALLLVSCSSVGHYQFGSLRAYAGQAGDDRYNSLTLDLSESSARHVPVFCIQLDPDAEPVRSDRLTPVLTARHLPEFKVPRYWPETWKRKARQHQAYEGNGYYVVFDQERLVALTLSLRETDPINPATRPAARSPRIGPPDCGRLYDLPLDREQMLAIFGPGGRETRHREVYY
jgi:hypothetical protein